jgi:hypothetical protein
MADLKTIIGIAVDASDKYLMKKASLTNELGKLAQANHLTADEIQRASEYANTRTYLELRKTSQYPEFELAEPEAVIKQANVEVVKESPKPVEVRMGNHTDYNYSPLAKSANFEKSAEKDKGFEKTAEMFYSKEVPSFNKEFRVLENTLNSDAMEFDTRVNKLSNQVRQLLLQGGQVAPIKTLFEMVDKSGMIWDIISKKLQEEFPMVKSAEVLQNKVLDLNNSFVKEVIETEKVASKLIDESIFSGALFSAIEKEAGLFIKQPKTLLKVLGGTALLGTAYMLGKKSHETAQNLREFEQYKQMRPTGPLK